MAKLKITTVSEEGTFEQAISKSPPEMQKIAHDLRALIAGILPGVTEVPWPRQGNTGYGVGPKKMSEQFCYIFPQTKYVNLGFYYGTDLDNSSGLLEGTGKSLRHIKIHSREDVKNPAVKKLLMAASKHLPNLK